jgi:integrase
MTTIPPPPTVPAFRPIPLAEFRDRLLSRPSKSNGVFIATKRVLCIAEELGVATTADLTPRFLERFVAGLDGKGLHEVTKRYYLYCLKRACNAAVTQGYIATSPFDDRPELDPRVRYRLPRQKRITFKSPAQFQALMDCLESRSTRGIIDHRLFALAAVVAHTGCCGYDAIKLRVADVDLEAGMIRFRYRERRKTLPTAVPMSPELRRILSGWLRSPFVPHCAHRALDEDEVREARQLRSEGWSYKALAERYGMSASGMSLALSEKLYRHIPERGEPLKTIADYEWVFPVLKHGAPAPWTSYIDNNKRLRDASKAVGIDGLTLHDLRYLHRYCVVPAVVALKPDQAAPRAEVPPVLLAGRTPWVLGEKRGRLSPGERDIVMALLDDYPRGLTWKELDQKSGRPHCRTAVIRLKSKHPDWHKVIELPGHKGGVCKLAYPRT